MNEELQKLIAAEQKAKELFAAVETSGLIVSGKSERQLAQEIVDLARDKFGIEKYWHKKIVRTGANTLYPYSGDPPNLLIENDDIIFLDFGPIFDGYEADLGRTYVLGNDPLKLKLKKDVKDAWHEANTWYHQQSSLTGADYFTYAVALAKKYGWEFGGDIAGHIVGPFPHAQLGADDLGLDVHPDNQTDILQPDKNGNKHAWILEIQFVDRVNNIGGFFEQLLNSGDHAAADF